jgi:hypothetical protein
MSPRRKSSDRSGGVGGAPPLRSIRWPHSTPLLPTWQHDFPPFRPIGVNSVAARAGFPLWAAEIRAVGLGGRAPARHAPGGSDARGVAGRPASAHIAVLDWCPRRDLIQDSGAVVLPSGLLAPKSRTAPRPTPYPAVVSGGSSASAGARPRAWGARREAGPQPPPYTGASRAPPSSSAAASAAATSNRTEGTSSSATTSWIFGPARAASSRTRRMSAKRASRA